MNDLDIIKKHLSPTIPFKIKNEDGTEDVINMKPLTVAQQSHLMIISKKFKKLNVTGTTEEEIAKSMENADGKDMNDAVNEVFDFFVNLITRSIEGISDELAKEFVDSNFDKLFNFIEELVPKNDEKSKIELIRKAREMQNVKSN